MWRPFPSPASLQFVQIRPRHFDGTDWLFPKDVVVVGKVKRLCVCVAEVSFFLNRPDINRALRCMPLVRSFYMCTSTNRSFGVSGACIVVRCKRAPVVETHDEEAVGDRRLRHLLCVLARFGLDLYEVFRVTAKVFCGFHLVRSAKHFGGWRFAQL